MTQVAFTYIQLAKTSDMAILDVIKVEWGGNKIRNGLETWKERAQRKGKQIFCTRNMGRRYSFLSSSPWSSLIFWLKRALTLMQTFCHSLKSTETQISNLNYRTYLTQSSKLLNYSWYFCPTLNSWKETDVFLLVLYPRYQTRYLLQINIYWTELNQTELNDTPRQDINSSKFPP